MIYTDKTKLAMNLSYDKHKNQFDKCAVPYIYHPIHLAEQMKDENTTIVALLHDVCEDTNTTAEDLVKFGFSNEIIEAIKVMTKLATDEYFEYIKKICKNEIAMKVKLADLKHNSDLTRFSVITEKDLQRKEKYNKAIEIIQEKMEERK